MAAVAIHAIRAIHAHIAKRVKVVKDTALTRRIAPQPITAVTSYLTYVRHANHEQYP